MHGGAKGSGAPKSNRNAFKHGFFTRKAIDERRDLRKLLSECQETLGEFE